MCLKSETSIVNPTMGREDCTDNSPRDFVFCKESPVCLSSWFIQNYCSAIFFKTIFFPVILNKKEVNIEADNVISWQYYDILKNFHLSNPNNF